jgi:uncharacterized protein YggU (UPF0235/DUF167 family)
MKINVLVKTGKKENKVIKNDFADYEVWVKSQPVKGAVNKELINVFSDYFNIKKCKLWILRGLTSKKKVIELKE